MAAREALQAASRDGFSSLAILWTPLTWRPIPCEVLMELAGAGAPLVRQPAAPPSAQLPYFLDR